MIQGNMNNRSAMDLIAELEGKVRKYKDKYYMEKVKGTLLPWVVGVVVGASSMWTMIWLGWWKI